MSNVISGKLEGLGKKMLRGLLVCACVLFQGCRDEVLEGNIFAPLQVEEGIEGELSLSLCTATEEKRQVTTRNSEHMHDEQYVHSAYVFVIDMDHPEKPEECRIIARHYFPDVTDRLVEKTEAGQKLRVTELKMQAVSCQHAQIFAIVNLGYSEVQGIDNDAELLEQCDALTHLKGLMELSARLALLKETEVEVDRMQGHHLMSGFFCAATERHFLHASQPTVTLKAEADGKIRPYHATTGKPYRPLGEVAKRTEQIPAAVFVHRLDSKITVQIEPTGSLKDTPGAFFRLTSWQVVNIPQVASLYWQNRRNAEVDKHIKHSRKFHRSITEGENNRWEFSFYQFENFYEQAKAEKLTSEEIAKQYNTEYNLKNGEQKTKQEVEAAFTSYPNPFSTFAYSLRERKFKRKGAEGTEGEYVPNAPGNKDETVVVVNGDFEFAPKNASYIRLEGEYYHPKEPAKRMKNDPRSQQLEAQYPLDQYPYWGEGQMPVKTKEEALKRMRMANVVYFIHLGYVGGGNYELNEAPLTAEKKDFAFFQKKVNDFNVLRNHHYIYKVQVAGVDNIKVEATREGEGNILQQEQQPGAEGTVLESQHWFNLDAHYETRNLTIDFRRMPENFASMFSFALETPYERLLAVLKKTADGKVQVVDSNGKPIEGIRGHDMDWIHFAWHGEVNNPSRSLVDATTGNGIAYSDTYGGYEHQQTYNETFLTKEQGGSNQYQLLNCMEFTQLVLRQFAQWIADGKPDGKSTMTFTVYVDEYYYDFNPVTHAQVDWYSFCSRPERKALFFMEPAYVSADQNSVYADAHVAIYQKSIQTLYATDTQNGQIIANVAFGIEALDEYRANYCSSNRYEDQYFGDGVSMDNGLYNAMHWFKRNTSQVIDWKTAASYYTDKSRSSALVNPAYSARTDERAHRRGQWALYSRNRDLNRNGRLESDEIRWFVPAIDQYTLCFLGGRSVFENPLYEKDKSITRTAGSSAPEWVHGIPMQHYMSSTKAEKNQIFWAEEGCSKGNYGQEAGWEIYGIRMARMLCKHGVNDTGSAFDVSLDVNKLKQDAVYIVSHTRNGMPVEYANRDDGKDYYVVFNKLNANAFRSYIRVGELALHTHEQKENWLYREYRIAKNKVGYTSYSSPTEFNRAVKVDGVPRTWWQLSGVWSPSAFSEQSIYYYRGEQQSLAYAYRQEPDVSDLHHWRMPNLREGAMMSMAFPPQWFGGAESSITCITRSENLGPKSTNVPYWNIRSGLISRLIENATETFYVRAIQDVK